MYTNHCASTTTNEFYSCGWKVWCPCWSSWREDFLLDELQPSHFLWNQAQWRVPVVPHQCVFLYVPCVPSHFCEEADIYIYTLNTNICIHIHLSYPYFWAASLQGFVSCQLFRVEKPPFLEPREGVDTKWSDDGRYGYYALVSKNWYGKHDDGSVKFVTPGYFTERSESSPSAYLCIFLKEFTYFGII